MVKSYLFLYFIFIHAGHFMVPIKAGLRSNKTQCKFDSTLHESVNLYC